MYNALVYKYKIIHIYIRNVVFKFDENTVSLIWQTYGIYGIKYTHYTEINAYNTVTI